MSKVEVVWEVQHGRRKREEKKGGGWQALSVDPDRCVESEGDKRSSSTVLLPGNMPAPTLTPATQGPR